MKYLKNLRNRLVGRVAMSGLALLIAELPASIGMAQEDNQDSQTSEISEDAREQRRAELRELMGGLTGGYTTPEFNSSAEEDLEAALEAASQVKGPEINYIEMRTGGEGNGEVGSINDFNNVPQPVIPLNREAPQIYEVPGSDGDYAVKMCGVNADETLDLVTVSLENRRTGEITVVESTYQTEDGSSMTLKRKVSERNVYARVQTEEGTLEFNLSDDANINWEPQRLSPDEEGCTYSIWQLPQSQEFNKRSELYFQVIANYLNEDGETVEESRTYSFDDSSINSRNEHDRAAPLIDLGDKSKPIVQDKHFPESLYAKLPGKALGMPNALAVSESRDEENGEEGIEDWAHQNSMYSGFLNSD